MSYIEENYLKTVLNSKPIDFNLSNKSCKDLITFLDVHDTDTNIKNILRFNEISDDFLNFQKYIIENKKKK